MHLSDLSFSLFRFLIPPAIILNLGLYLYAPLLDCSFPEAKRGEPACFIPGQERDAIPTEIAPFRLLAFGDPQLEGDTSLPTGHSFASLEELGRKLRDGEWSGFVGGFGHELSMLVTRDIPWLLYGYRKRLDLWGNDHYLAHIYRSVSWWAQPTHVVVLGDLLGSQWIGDEEFQRRSDRFWRRVFKGTERVPPTITGSSGRVEVLGEDDRWKKRVIAVAGNHDIGYGGDIDEHRIERFEKTYGNVNWDIRFRLDNASSSPSQSNAFGSSPLDVGTPELHIVVLNSMNLDSPAKDLELQQQSRDFAEAQLFHSPGASNPKSATVLLTHIPLFKDPGVCVDTEFFDWFPEGGIKEQNRLLKGSSDYLLNGLAGDGSRGKAIVLNGHDHEGCDTFHYRKLGDNESPWEGKENEFADAERSDESLSSVREITVRSMMGEFHGTAGFLSGWYDREGEEWKFEYSSCPLGVQHIWWGVHIFDIVVIGLGLASVVFAVVEELAEQRRTAEQQKNEKLKTT
jgi:hypothetical protein